VRIAVDAMGGDHAPQVIVAGCAAAARDYNIPIILVGDRDAVRRELDQIDAPESLLEIHHCTQVAGMDESPTDVLRHKKDASIRVAFDLVKAGEAGAAVSAGNSGASLAVGTVVFGRMKGVERPGIAGVFPTTRGRTVVIDIGANVDCKPSYLYQFAIMAEAYAQELLGLDRPKIGLLSIGEEDTKGNELVRKTHELLKTSSLNFIGNVEGRDVMTGAADVVVCDGFVGNVVLKLAEGMAEAISQMLKEELESGFVTRMGMLLSYSAFRRFKQTVDYAESGGAPLLGLKGVGIISHGRSSPKAIKNAVRLASNLAVANLPERLQKRLMPEALAE
jgi:glycerol-3-phosphate acyltransferase PlsX